MLPHAIQQRVHQTCLPFWRSIPGWREASDEEFENWLWQERNSVTTVDGLAAVLGEQIAPEFMEDLRAGMATAPMAMRLTPYVVALINWNEPYADPLRRQFLPLASEYQPPHPLLRLDSLDEHGDTKTPGLVHRYPDRALFLATDHCPVYCRFCTRSYSVGLDTETVTKDRNSPTRERWERIFKHIRETPTINDVVVSGGDCFRLKASQITLIGQGLLAIPHVRRIRFATKGLAIEPMKILSAPDWTDALIALCDAGRRTQVEVVLHSHFNHPHEITEYTIAAANHLFSRGITVRNQAVLLRGVNDDPVVLAKLVKTLSDLHIHPYYVYACDLVDGIEDLRLPIRRVCELEKYVRGVTAGYNTPAFVVDAPGGGGKRVVHSYELYDPELGLTAYTAPSVKSGAVFIYPDPLSSLSPERRLAWLDPERSKEMLCSFTDRARAVL
ncbi:KamA family radical SAM protein [Agrobacterium pusense]|uniref:KamA family radical SAM protein n=1 Tax=Agrobacterium pusense TaxID=648995 RepID=A0AA44EG84_9HYPH|nr:KamA family radical SAM protein [Agrobacterium pusense]NRF07763.1 KamA family radical SAM protein [Agrobacterium pusense]NRF18060.1 KamA family radical SAM protein [Agrobacterium pusense]PZU78346.1 MAG: KamA family radical SAM protein [Rhizobium sp.]